MPYIDNRALSASIISFRAIKTSVISSSHTGFQISSRIVESSLLTSLSSSPPDDQLSYHRNQLRTSSETRVMPASKQGTITSCRTINTTINISSGPAPKNALYQLQNKLHNQLLYHQNHHQNPAPYKLRTYPMYLLGRKLQTWPIDGSYICFIESCVHHSRSPSI